MISYLIPTLGVEDCSYLHLFCIGLQRNCIFPYEILIYDNSEEQKAFDWGKSAGHTVFRGSIDTGIGEAYRTMSSEAKYPVLFHADDDYYPAPGWDIAAEYALKNKVWRSPHQVEAGRPQRSINRMFGRFSNEFNLAGFEDEFNSNVLQGWSKKQTYQPCFITKEDYFTIGPHREDMFGGEMDWIWRCHEYYTANNKVQSTHDGSYCYHFRGRTPRPPGFAAKGKADKELLSREQGKSESEMDDIMCHYTSIPYESSKPL